MGVLMSTWQTHLTSILNTLLNSQNHQRALSRGRGGKALSIANWEVASLLIIMDVLLMHL
jgi:hypothetical protein